jgi:hypothetical protein
LDFSRALPRESQRGNLLPSTAGQTHELLALSEQLIVADGELIDSDGERVPRPVALGGDGGYRANWIDEYLLSLSIKPVIPSKKTKLGLAAKFILTKRLIVEETLSSD